MKNLLLFLVLLCNCQKHKIEPGVYYVDEDTETSIQVQKYGSSECVTLNPSPVVTKKNFKTVYITESASGNIEISIKLNDAGSKRFQQATSNWIGKRMAIVLDDIVFSTPEVETEIPNGTIFISNPLLTKESCERIVKKFQ